MSLDPNQYPATLIDGDVLAACYTAIGDALKTVMPADGKYRYVPITPRPSETQWRAFTSKTPAVGIGWQAWHGDKSSGRVFRGTLIFSVAILTEHRMPDHLYLGDSRVPGAFGVTAAAIGVLNGLFVDGAGTARVVDASSAELAQFLSEGQASVLLTIHFDSVTLDMDRIRPQLDDLKTISQVFPLDNATEVDLDTELGVQA